MGIAVAARGLVTRGGGDRLLVSDHGHTWYTPGVRFIPGESLKECVVREVYEETGLTVEVDDLVHVAEFWGEEAGQRKGRVLFPGHAPRGSASGRMLAGSTGASAGGPAPPSGSGQV